MNVFRGISEADLGNASHTGRSVWLLVLVQTNECVRLISEKMQWHANEVEKEGEAACKRYCRCVKHCAMHRETCSTAIYRQRNNN